MFCGLIYWYPFLKLQVPLCPVRVATSGVERVKRSGEQRGSVRRAARGRGCMGGGMEEAATKRAAKGAVRARR